MLRLGDIYVRVGRGWPPITSLGNNPGPDRVRRSPRHWRCRALPVECKLDSLSHLAVKPGVRCGEPRNQNPPAPASSGGHFKVSFPVTVSSGRLWAAGAPGRVAGYHQLSRAINKPFQSCSNGHQITVMATNGHQITVGLVATVHSLSRL